MFLIRSVGLCCSKDLSHELVDPCHWHDLSLNDGSANRPKLVRTAANKSEKANSSLVVGVIIIDQGRILLTRETPSTDG